MRDYLVFRLYGPMASWGRIAVGESRHSDACPSKSAIMGLLGAALGIRRTEEERHDALFRSYGFGVKVRAMDTLMQDFHTTQVPPEQRNIRHHTRYEEMGNVPKLKLKTALSVREYRCDAECIVGVWCLTDTPPHTLAQLKEALRQPRFVLYLGRKSCPVAWPLQPRIVSEDDLKAALDAEFEALPVRGGRLRPHHGPHYYWEDGADTDMRAQQQIQRHDVCVSRKRWQFGTRRENIFIAQEEENVL